MKGLEALKEIRESATLIEEEFFLEGNSDQLDQIEKELKAFEIIKSKGIDITTLKAHEKAKTYNEHTKFAYCKDYTDEEFDLLKEVLQ